MVCTRESHSRVSPKSATRPTSRHHQALSSNKDTSLHNSRQRVCIHPEGFGSHHSRKDQEPFFRDTRPGPTQPSFPARTTLPNVFVFVQTTLLNNSAKKKRTVTPQSGTRPQPPAYMSRLWVASPTGGSHKVPPVAQHYFTFAL